MPVITNLSNTVTRNSQRHGTAKKINKRYQNKKRYKIFSEDMIMYLGNLNELDNLLKLIRELSKFV